MKRILIVSLLIVYSIIILSSCNRKSNNNISKSESSENHVSKNSGAEKKNNTIVWCALIVSIFANGVFTVICFTKMEERSKKRYVKLREKYEELNSTFNFEKHQNSKSSNIVYKLSDSDINMIVDRVLECKRLDSEEKETVIDSPIVTQHTCSEEKYLKKLYATAANEHNTSFAIVTEQPDEHTIYLLSLTNENNASFEIYENSKKTIIGCEDYLRNVCDIIGSGRNIESCEPGIAEKTSDGSWKVVKKANVKFV